APPQPWLERLLARGCRLAADGRLRLPRHTRPLALARRALAARGHLGERGRQLFDLALGEAAAAGAMLQ
ncbi:hypothetical protein MNEG_3322, partial [Monoraphidium neglectum]